MFENLSERLSGVFDRLTKQGALSEEDVKTALREVRVALLEADVSLPVARDFVRKVQDQATGKAVTKSITPGQQVVKIVHDALVEVLRGEEDPGALKVDNPPAPILMIGLQGSGKTTTTGKLAKRLKEKEGKKILMASLDIYRPAAMDQLAVLGTQVGVDTLPIVPGQKPVDIAKRAKQQATLGGYDVYMLDTAGRLHINEVLMEEVEQVRNAVNPRETLLVVDGLTGQVAVEVAEEFDAKVGISGVVLTRMDGDGRGGAALSMRAVTGKPIRFVGLGEKMDALETFEPDRIAGRILGMGDIVALVEKARETMEMENTERIVKRLVKGQFNMNDMKMQLDQTIKMGGRQTLMGMMGMNKWAKQLDQTNADDKILRHQIALIQSMTKRERANPQLLQSSRKKRIAAGSGLEVSDLNKLLKTHRHMSDMLRKMGRKDKGNMLKQIMKGMFTKGGSSPDQWAESMDPKVVDQAVKLIGRSMPGGLPGLPGGMGLPPGLSGLGKKK